MRREPYPDVLELWSVTWTKERYGNDLPENGPLVPLAKNLVQQQHSRC
jgi:hypothetical protein